MRRSSKTESLVLLLVLAACGGDDRGPTVTVDPDAPVPQSSADPVCVWNQAYQENTEPDAVSAILAGASGCYVLLDPFDDPDAAAAIDALKAADNTVGCYMSVGTCEAWRDDFDDIRGFCSDREWGEWEGEFFVEDVDGIAPFMRARIDQFAAWGCDMVEFDNMDWAWEAENYGFDLTVDASIAYYQGLCDHVHDQGMGCMAKNTRDGAEAFDGGTFESYPDELDWWEHDDLQSFLDEGRLAVMFHYDEPDCADVTLWYRQRYGSGLSVLCEDPSVGGYAH